MKVTGKELREMRERVANGTADDNDRRLVDLYGDGEETAPDDAADAQRVGVTSVAEAEVIRGGAGTGPKKSARSRTR
jgi:hypothetical protein